MHALHCAFPESGALGNWKLCNDVRIISIQRHILLCAWQALLVSHSHHHCTMSYCTLHTRTIFSLHQLTMI